ncbi:MAG: hypothetical protein AAF518_05205 [Spirochaetota bacterium]
MKEKLSTTFFRVVLGSTMLKIGLSLMKNIFRPELISELPQILHMLADIPDKSDSVRMMKMSMQYLQRFFAKAEALGIHFS